MTADELADALDARAARNVPGENTAFVRVSVTLLADAARMLRTQHAMLLDTGRSLALLVEAIERTTLTMEAD